jgi:putative ABC transport system permease protein
LCFIFALVFWHMQDVRIGVYFALGIGALIILSAGTTRFVLMGLNRWHVQWLSVRQAVRGLFRQGNATQSIVITLTVSLCVIFSIFLIEQNLDYTFVQSFPSNSPNLFFVDIQPDQKGPFSQIINRHVQFYPIVRARVTALNGQPINRQKEQKKRQDNLGRMFNLTYRSHLLIDEKIIAGDSLFRKDWTETQVSILDTVVRMKEMKMGDTLTFKIQGIPLKARIASIRSRDRESFSPFFYFVFQNKTLSEAPQTLFAAIRATQNQVGRLQNKIVTKFPNVSVIDISATLRTFARLMRQLSKIINFFSILSIISGILILVSAVFATRSERILESVYYKILGAPRSFVLKVLTLENLAIGLLSSVMALIMAQIATWMICRYILDISYRAFILSCIGIIFITVLLVIFIGFTASWSILTKKPVTYLREQPDA